MGSCNCSAPRRLCKEYVGRKVNNALGVNLHQHFAFTHTLSSPGVVIRLAPIIQLKNESLVSGQLRKSPNLDDL